MRSALSVSIICLRLISIELGSMHDWSDRGDGGRSVKLDAPNK